MVAEKPSATLPQHNVVLFVDGLGIGKKDRSVNPLVSSSLPVLEELCGGEIFHKKHKSISTSISEVRAVRATLGVPGLPQSGTGQTALFTGVNGAKVFGRHFGPYPPAILRRVLQEKNIFLEFKKRGKSVIFANAFPQPFFDYTSSGTQRLPVLTYSCIVSNVPLLTVGNLLTNDAISADLVRERWKEFGHPDVPTVSPREAGKHLAFIAKNYTLTIFEYFLTDRAGHTCNMDIATDVLERLDQFIGGFLEEYDPTTMLFIIISDHGNIEDLSTKSHTRNEVPCIACGSGRKLVADRIKSLVDFTPTLLYVNGHIVHYTQ
ncbi:MAG: alkaline phosphatase family protein [Bacteroidetes bacterium]|nr:alkaline phosphatase family protein [Bacteroidota bacterium]